MQEFPPEIITEILFRLPVKSLLRFRCVSKPWCSQIDSPKFTKLHLRHSIKAKSNISLILGRRTSPPFIYSIDFDKLDRAVEVENPVKELAVSACCNGLLLLKEVSMKEYRLALFNPQTRRHKVIPVCPLGSSYNGLLLKLHGFPNGGPCGLGYDAVNDDYKIISIVEFACNGKWVGSETNIYSLNRNEWKPMKNFPRRLPCVKEWGVHLGGKLHTLVKRNGDFYGVPDVILVTDLVKEDYLFMELPDFCHEDVSKMGISVLEAEESLCFYLVYKGFCTELWMMKEYGVRSSWTKLLSVAPSVLPPSTYLDPLICSKDMNKVLFCMKESKLCWYDIKAEQFINIPVCGAPDEFYVDVCVDSLVRPDGYAKADKNQPKAQEKVINKNQTNKKRDDFLAKGFKLKL